MPSWAFLKDGAGILPASNMADTLGGSDLSPAEILVRESVQNSLDERRRDNNIPIRIQFERRTLIGNLKTRFVDNLGLGELSARRTSFTRSFHWISDGDDVLDSLHNPAVAMPILLISDFGANGLGGRWNRRGSRQDRFFNLVLSIDGSPKWEDEAETVIGRTLGSYGYGKIAFAMCSDIRVAVYYSTFQPDAASGNAHCRAMATAFLPRHSERDVDYAGQAYFGDDSEEERVPRKPLVDDNAHSWVCDLGLPPRHAQDTGVTVVIPAAQSTIAEIVDCCETWWWPRMMDPVPARRVIFEFIDEGATVSGCQPRSRPYISHFMDCFKLVNARMPGAGYRDHDVTVIPEGKRRIAGRLVLKAVNDAADTDGQDNTFTNCIALVRDGLVIKYESRFAHEDKFPVVGVFAPDTDFETHQALVLSEPPSHNDWIENAERLRGRYKWGREFIRLTKNRIRSHTRDFQASQVSLPESESTNAAAFLRKTLGQLFIVPRKRTNDPAPPLPQRRAFTIATRASGRRQSTDRQSHEDYVVFRIGISEHAAEDQVSVEVAVSLKALTDVDGSPTDALPCEIAALGGVYGGREKATFVTELYAGKEIDIQARGEVHPQWKTQWEIAVTKVD